MVDGSPVTSGRFTVNASGQLSQTAFAVDRDKLENATTFVFAKTFSILVLIILAL